MVDNDPQSLIIGGIQTKSGEDTAFDSSRIEEDANLVVVGQHDVEARVIEVRHAVAVVVKAVADLCSPWIDGRISIIAV